MTPNDTSALFCAGVAAFQVAVLALLVHLVVRLSRRPAPDASYSRADVERRLAEAGSDAELLVRRTANVLRKETDDKLAGLKAWPLVDIPSSDYRRDGAHELVDATRPAGKLRRAAGVAKVVDLRASLSAEARGVWGYVDRDLITGTRTPGVYGLHPAARLWPRSAAALPGTKMVAVVVTRDRVTLVDARGGPLPEPVTGPEDTALAYDPGLKGMLDGYPEG